MSHQIAAGWVGLREFEDAEGVGWVAGVRASPGKNFKGRFFFVARPLDAPDDPGEEVVLGDIRWNSEDTARRTVRTMSGVELRRRLRSARGRSAG